MWFMLREIGFVALFIAAFCGSMHSLRAVTHPTRYSGIVAVYFEEADPRLIEMLNEEYIQRQPPEGR
jgi:hypothetical protein